jgi:hypothetical protein
MQVLEKGELYSENEKFYSKNKIKIIDMKIEL